MQYSTRSRGVSTRVEERGSGEILLTSVDRKGTWEAFDLDVVKRVADAVSIPVIAHRGAGCVGDIGKAVKQAGASAVALGSMVVFQKKEWVCWLISRMKRDLNPF
jgi:cyclase